MVFCRGCGKEIHETAQSCPHCGALQCVAVTRPYPAIDAGNNAFQRFFIEVILHQYTLNTGRATRQEYWMYALFYFLINLAISLVCGVIGGVGTGAELGDVAGTIYLLGLLLPSINIAVRRMHDIGRSGWWILFPVVNFIFLCLPSQEGQNQFGARR
jgi:uncharacterized membrane protein YhaH (DUF805 family)